MIIRDIFNKKGDNMKKINEIKKSIILMIIIFNVNKIYSDIRKIAEANAKVVKEVKEEEIKNNPCHGWPCSRGRPSHYHYRDRRCVRGEQCASGYACVGNVEFWDDGEPKKWGTCRKCPGNVCRGR